MARRQLLLTANQQRLPWVNKLPIKHRWTCALGAKRVHNTPKTGPKQVQTGVQKIPSGGSRLRQNISLVISSDFMQKWCSFAFYKIWTKIAENWFNLHSLVCWSRQNISLVISSDLMQKWCIFAFFKMLTKIAENWFNLHSLVCWSRIGRRNPISS